MRELKFRAWDKGHNKMSYKVNLYSLNNTGRLDRAQLDNKQIMNIIGFDCEVMQFTGLKDKNGKEIYEGDIIKSWYSRDMSGTDIITMIEAVQHEISYETSGFIVPFIETAEIIGNIFQTPELIQQPIKP